MMAAEMAIIRLTHVADLPSPEELVRKLNNATPPPPLKRWWQWWRHGPAQSVATTAIIHACRCQEAAVRCYDGFGRKCGSSLARYPTFEHVIELIRSSRDVKLLVDLETTLQLAHTNRVVSNLCQLTAHR